MSLKMLSGKTAIVTGALGGIGFAIAEKLASEGAELMISDLRVDELKCSHLLDAGAPRVETMRCDVADEQSVIALANATVERFGKIDIVVNVAGAISYASIAELNAADWLRGLSINFLGAAVLTSESFRKMASGGVILNISSIHAHATAERVAPYAAAKTALISLTRSAAIEGKALGIRVNAILPGAIDTEMLRASPNIAAGLESFDPAYTGQPADIADAALFLVSDASRFVTGASLLVDGGLLASF